MKTSNKPGKRNIRVPIRWAELSDQKQQSFLKRIARELKQESIRLVEPLSGLGGAFTSLAVSEHSRGRAVSVVVKIGPEEELKRERDALVRAKLAFHNVCEVIGSPIVHDGLTALVLALAGGSNAVTFSTYFEQTVDCGKIVSFINNLFTNTLRRKDQSLKRINRNVFELHVKDMPSLSMKLKGLGSAHPNLADWCEKAAAVCKAKSTMIFSHGDLHGQNVLAANNQPYLVDCGLTGDLHVMSDLAKFEREIRLKLFLKDREDALDYSKCFDAWFSSKNRDVSQPEDSNFRKVLDSIECIRAIAKQSLLPDEDWKFEYYSALLIQYVRAASNAHLGEGMRRAALNLAERYQRLIDLKFGGDIIETNYTSNKQRKRPLWRLAYSFLRLDQLPSGGWGKTLPQWMENIWEGDAGSIIRSPEMFKTGGTDFTCSAFHNYFRFIERCVPADQIAGLSRENAVPAQLFENLKARIDSQSGMNARRQGRAENQKINLRHTAMGAISLLMFGKSNRFTTVALRELELTTSYLIANLTKWEEDESYVFGMFCALSKLTELLRSEDGVRQFPGRSRRLRELLITRINSVLPMIQRKLIGYSDYLPLPTGTAETLAANPFFVPYGRFWRMERSGFFMYVPLLISENRGAFLSHFETDQNLKDRFRQCFSEVLKDVSVPFDQKNPSHSLVRYHRKLEKVEPPRDWGLSAGVAMLLRTAAIGKLLLANHSQSQLDGIYNALHAALLSTFDEFHKHPEIFQFTHAVSLSHFLDLIDGNEVGIEELINLDKAVFDLLKIGVTEKSLESFIAKQLLEVNTHSGETNLSTIVNLASVRDLLLNKLQSGEHTPDNKICLPLGWEHRVEDAIKKETITYYDGPGGRTYESRYVSDPIIASYVSRLDDLFERKSSRSMKALDIACGPGQYSKLLKSRGFDVDLYDASKQMLRLAAERIGDSKKQIPKDYYHLEEECSDAYYDLVFASAMMVHVPLNRAQSIYREFHRILKPGGVLFVNYKIGDHSLIARDGRYFQYYRNGVIPREMLRTTGFEIVHVIESWNQRTSNDLPREIHWLSFFCVKPRALQIGPTISNYQRTG